MPSHLLHPSIRILHIYLAFYLPCLAEGALWRKLGKHHAPKRPEEEDMTWVAAGAVP